MANDLDAIFSGEHEDTLSLQTETFQQLMRIQKVCRWLMRERKEQTVISNIKDEFGCSEPQAHQWMQKAQAYMASAAMDDVEAARSRYLQRLEEIYHLAMSRSQQDEIEITERPVKVRNDDNGKREIITGKIVKHKPRAFNANAVALAIKSAKEMARIQGADRAPGDDDDLAKMLGGARISGNNVQVNIAAGQIPSAQQTADLANHQLAECLGVEAVGVLPDGHIELTDGDDAGEEADEDAEEGGDGDGDEEGSESSEAPGPPSS